LKSSSEKSVPGDLVQVGKVIGAHGMDGTVRVYSYAESVECFAPGKQLVLVDRMQSSLQHAIVRSDAYKKIMRLKLEGVNSRTQAEALIESAVFLSKTDLPPLEPDTFYWSDVIGMDVVTVAGEFLGRVVQIIPTGANDVYVIETPPDHASREILIPAIASVVIDIDVEQRRMRVELPEGLV
jgi:16S rRNA processing protein RimM